ncbi:predicted protein [Sclerotinia sclerotiorum 1980 UF-70]|uniref:Uncharacterized protein n=1 Tax=Sclerotinia sclerotiorum (strain ATCC 18683 / 1980 / Ss-1) TaxID=665079 RepID=A7F4T9_SCLS1|nr:predicted protein [Sclerotinia sclerotiorum 1980 UF-70]EDN97760.1 predicted protein [Sclerotinia sclerotiorum 1980 UF-70]
MNVILLEKNRKINKCVFTTTREWKWQSKVVNKILAGSGTERGKEDPDYLFWNIRQF